MVNATLYDAELFSPVIFWFEKDFDYKSTIEWLGTNYFHLLSSVPLYLMAVLILGRFMRNRPRYELRTELTLWNVGLALFSVLGFLRTFPEFAYSMSNFGFRYTSCVPTNVTMNRVTAFWTYAFVMSKVVEMGDTFFVLARKQKLVFLHWYHHAAVPLYCFLYATRFSAMSRWFVWINYGVHGLMYSYYAARSRRFAIPRWFSMSITVLQIWQMLVNLCVASIVLGYKYSGVDCDARVSTALATIFLYLSLGILFFNFFFQAYLPAAPPSNRKLD